MLRTSPRPLPISNWVQEQQVEIPITSHRAMFHVSCLGITWTRENGVYQQSAIMVPLRISGRGERGTGALPFRPFLSKDNEDKCMDITTVLLEPRGLSAYA